METTPEMNLVAAQKKQKLLREKKHIEGSEAWDKDFKEVAIIRRGKNATNGLKHTELAGQAT